MHCIERALQPFGEAGPRKRMIFLREAGYGLACQANADEIEMAGWILPVEVIFGERHVIAGLRDAVTQPQHLFRGKRTAFLGEYRGAGQREESEDQAGSAGKVSCGFDPEISLL